MPKIADTLRSRLRDLAERVPERKLLGDVNGWLTVREVLARAEGYAAALSALGVRAGDFVALRAERRADACLILFGLEFIGAVTVLTDLRRDAAAFIKDCAVPVPVAAYIARGENDQWEYRDAVGGEVVPLIARMSAAPLPTVDAGRDTPGYIIFTSGSTGKNKPVVLSQYSLINNILDAEPLGDYRDGDTALGALPLDHVFGLVLLTGAAVLGYGIYFPESTDVPTILRAVEREKITRMNGVPSLYLAMAERAADCDLSSLRAGFIGGGPCTPEQFLHIENALGMTLISAYGMSECVGITSASWRDAQENRARSVGRFYARNTGKILLEDGSEAAPGQEGEICVDGHARMLGYYGDDAPRPELLHTGDLGYLDEKGFVHLTGRKKDIIIRNGINLSPRKIEEALLSLPGVEDAAVVGLPEERLGEVPCAMAASARDAEDILSALAPLLAKNELPAGIMTVPELPLTAAGKPDKQRIREALSAWRNG